MSKTRTNGHRNGTSNRLSIDHPESAASLPTLSNRETALLFAEVLNERI
jgi:hypothetical protein